MSSSPFEYQHATAAELAAMRVDLQKLQIDLDHAIAFADERILCVIGCDMGLSPREAFYKLFVMADDEQIELAANLMRSAIARELLVRDEIRLNAVGN